MKTSILVMFAAVTLAVVLPSCWEDKPPPLTPQQKAAAADATYMIDALKCVDDATTLAESKACRDAKRAEWKRKQLADAGAPEGGVQ